MLLAGLPSDAGFNLSVWQTCSMLVCRLSFVVCRLRNNQDEFVSCQFYALMNANRRVHTLPSTNAESLVSMLYAYLNCGLQAE